ncbi:ABC transporter permease [Nonomuraea soli]|uniref:ABC-type transport system involved in multi-copper enzyme maturation permease subunit n=1 Tax=Nonomuraea soli TaxID=1032476 RepID=A0A7W0CS22_9ACTN|nr:ABC transporter permease [Nonomuraea soli]MBA2896266.1 ABC-type transport system involved in multi-copper enzyme maturation permease subunit [Nonomuraea soli]
MKLVRAELLKLFTTHLWWIMLVVVLSYLTLSLGLVIGFAGLEQNGVSVFPARDTPEFQRVAWEQSISGSILVAILGATMMTTEFRYQTITSTFLTTPRRARVVAAKLGAGVLVGLIFGLAILVLFAVGIVPAVLLSGGDLLITEGGIPRILGGVLAALVLYTLFGIGIGALLRNQIAAIVTVAVWMFVLEPIVNAIPQLQVVGAWTPAGAARSLTNSGVDVGQMGLDYLLPAWGGALVLLGYAAVFGLLASATTLRRDIT